MAWTPEDAHRFLQAIPAFEAAGPEPGQIGPGDADTGLVGVLALDRDHEMGIGKLAAQFALVGQDLRHLGANLPQGSVRAEEALDQRSRLGVGVGAPDRARRRLAGALVGAAAEAAATDLGDGRAVLILDAAAVSRRVPLRAMA